MTPALCATAVTVSAWAPLVSISPRAIETSSRRDVLAGVGKGCGRLPGFSDPAQMRGVVKPRVLEPVAERAVEADMSQPDHCDGDEPHCAGEPGDAAQHGWTVVVWARL